MADTLYMVDTLYMADTLYMVDTLYRPVGGQITEMTHCIWRTHCTDLWAVR